MQVFILFYLLLQTFLHCSKAAEPDADLQIPCRPPVHNQYNFCNTSISISERANSIISALTLSEKISQLSNNASAIPRLGIPAYQWWSESLHGVAGNGAGVSFEGAIPSATCFPQIISLAASFNRSLWYDVASSIAVEARAMYNYGQAGLTFWAPNVNIFRDPRWGRGQETPGEDPFLSSSFAVAFVRGFQGSSSGVLSRDEVSGRMISRDVDENGGLMMLSACCKHFISYDLEKWQSFSRYNFNALVSKQDLEDTYQPPFKSCIQLGGASCLMCSYNEINGIPACAGRYLLEKPRNDWGFNGYITSDCDAVATIYEYQKYVSSKEDAVSSALRAGLDINCGTYMVLNTQSAIDQGKVREEDIDRAIHNLFSVQLRLGLFDGDPRSGPHGRLGPSDVCSSVHRSLALEAARQGIVLLKNEHGFLPFNEGSISSMAVIGPLFDDVGNLGGGYSGVPCGGSSFFEGVKKYVGTVYGARGCTDVSCPSAEGFGEAVSEAGRAEASVVVAGLDVSEEREDHDRVSLLLPGKQVDLISSIALSSRNPVVLVLTGGGPLDVSFAQNDPRIASILWVGYPGEAGGEALADVLFGRFNPGGRLPVTWYPEEFTAVPMNDMRMRAAGAYPGRTYRFYVGPTVYNFGHGLSYANFRCGFLSAPKSVTLRGFRSRIRGFAYVEEAAEGACESARFEVRISVENTGPVGGTHTVIMYARAPEPGVVRGAPQKQLAGFERVVVAAHGSETVTLMVDPCEHLSISDADGERVLVLGLHELMVDDDRHSFLVRDASRISPGL